MLGAFAYSVPLVSRRTPLRRGATMAWLLLLPCVRDPCGTAEDVPAALPQSATRILLHHALRVRATGAARVAHGGTRALSAVDRRFLARGGRSAGSLRWGL